MHPLRNTGIKEPPKRIKVEENTPLLQCLAMADLREAKTLGAVPGTPIWHPSAEEHAGLFVKGTPVAKW